MQTNSLRRKMKHVEQHTISPKRMLGWREWVGLPELAIPAIKAKIDTGARTSALHAFYIEPFTSDGKEYVRFGIHLKRKTRAIEKQCIAPIIDRRMVTDSGGRSEERIVICTPIMLGNEHWPAEITLTNRDGMKFSMLLGRSALSGHCQIDICHSYLAGRPPKEAYTELARGFVRTS
jgi:hypothetical protein